LTTDSDCSDVTVSGREFQTREAAIGKSIGYRVCSVAGREVSGRIPSVVWLRRDEGPVRPTIGMSGK